MGRGMNDMASMMGCGLLSMSLLILVMLGVIVRFESASSN